MCDSGVCGGVTVVVPMVVPCSPPTGMHNNEELCGEDIIKINTGSIITFYIN